MDLNAAVAALETLLAELKSAAVQAPQPQSPPAVHDDVLTAAQLAQRLQISTSSTPSPTTALGAPFVSGFPRCRNGWRPVASLRN
jgi:LmbE family N-acetylglucosaminyl deacetylase